jgi:hypothetical protein
MKEFSKIFKKSITKKREEVAMKIYNKLMIKYKGNDKFPKFWFNKYHLQNKLKLNKFTTRNVYEQTKIIISNKFPGVKDFTKFNSKGVWKKIKNKKIKLMPNVKQLIYNAIIKIGKYKRLHHNNNYDRGRYQYLYNRNEEDLFKVIETDQIFAKTKVLLVKDTHVFYNYYIPDHIVRKLKLYDSLLNFTKAKKDRPYEDIKEINYEHEVINIIPSICNYIRENKLTFTYKNVNDIIAKLRVYMKEDEYGRKLRNMPVFKNHKSMKLFAKNLFDKNEKLKLTCIYENYILSKLNFIYKFKNL